MSLGDFLERFINTYVDLKVAGTRAKKPAPPTLEQSLAKIAADRARPRVNYRLWEPEARIVVETGWQFVVYGGPSDPEPAKPGPDKPWRVNYEHYLEHGQVTNEKGQPTGATYWTKKICRTFGFATEKERDAFIAMWATSFDEKRGPSWRLSKGGIAKRTDAAVAGGAQ